VVVQHVQGLPPEGRSPRELVSAALVAADLCLCRGQREPGALPAAQTAAEDALQRALAAELRREAALARRLLGQCLLAAGQTDAALRHLRTAETTLTAMGAALEAARTRLVLAEVLATGTSAPGLAAEARLLLGQAQAQFTASGAVRDLAQAAGLARRWASTVDSGT
jgi:hypothetical protein